MTQVIREGLRTKAFKADIKEEVPAFFHKPYHADLGVLMRSRENGDAYFFFIVELDSKLGHRTKLNDLKEDERARTFIVHNHIYTVRINLEDVVGTKKRTESELFEKIYITVGNQLIFSSDPNIEKNKEFAIRLKENAFTKCRGCDHLAVHHNLNGCEYKQTNKMKLKCHCNEPFFRSDS